MSSRERDRDREYDRRESSRSREMREPSRTHHSREESLSRSHREEPRETKVPPRVLEHRERVKKQITGAIDECTQHLRSLEEQFGQLARHQSDLSNQLRVISQQKKETTEVEARLGKLLQALDESVEALLGVKMTDQSAVISQVQTVRDLVTSLQTQTKEVEKEIQGTLNKTSQKHLGVYGEQQKSLQIVSESLQSLKETQQTLTILPETLQTFKSSQGDLTKLLKSLETGVSDLRGDLERVGTDVKLVKDSKRASTDDLKPQIDQISKDFQEELSELKKFVGEEFDLLTTEIKDSKEDKSSKGTSSKLEENLLKSIASHLSPLPQSIREAIGIGSEGEETLLSVLREENKDLRKTVDKLSQELRELQEETRSTKSEILDLKDLLKEAIRTFTPLESELDVVVADELEGEGVRREPKGLGEESRSVEERDEEPDKETRSEEEEPKNPEEPEEESRSVKEDPKKAEEPEEESRSAEEESKKAAEPEEESRSVKEDPKKAKKDLKKPVEEPPLEEEVESLLDPEEAVEEPPQPKGKTKTVRRVGRPPGKAKKR